MELLGTNWKTNAAGIGGLLTGVGTLVGMIAAGKMDMTAMAAALNGIVLSLGMFVAKHSYVTGGTVRQ